MAAEDLFTPTLQEHVPRHERALVEAAIDEGIDEALDSGSEPPLTMAHLEMALARTRPTTLDGWRGRELPSLEGGQEAARPGRVGIRAIP